MTELPALPTFLVLAAAICAAGAMYADRREARPPVFYALKPLTTVLIIAFALLQQPDSAAYRQWIVIALALSLLGDIALMFHGERWFLTGLGCFLVAHLAFIAAFLSGVGQYALPWWIAVSPAAGLVVLPLLWPGAGVLRPAVAVYGLVLCAMVLAAAARCWRWPERCCSSCPTRCSATGSSCARIRRPSR